MAPQRAYRVYIFIRAYVLGLLPRAGAPPLKEVVVSRSEVAEEMAMRFGSAASREPYLIFPTPAALAGNHTLLISF